MVGSGRSRPRRLPKQHRQSLGNQRSLSHRAPYENTRSPVLGVTRLVHLVQCASAMCSTSERSRRPLLRLEIPRNTGPSSAFGGVACGPSKMPRQTSRSFLVSATSRLTTLESVEVEQGSIAPRANWPSTVRSGTRRASEAVLQQAHPGYRHQHCQHSAQATTRTGRLQSPQSWRRSRSHELRPV